MAVRSPYLRRAVLWSIRTMRRREETIALRYSDLDLGNAIATIVASAAKGKRNRYVPLNAIAQSVLDEFPKPTGPSAFVFGNSLGGPQEYLERAWREALAKSKLADFRFHDLHHTGASRCVMAGIDLAVLRELLGHRDFEMTLRYAHLAPSGLKEAVAVLAPKRAKKVDESRTLEAPRRLPENEWKRKSLVFRKKDGAPDPTRTGDLRLRRPTLYPAELRARGRRLPERG